MQKSRGSLMERSTSDVLHSAQDVLTFRSHLRDTGVAQVAYLEFIRQSLNAIVNYIFYIIFYNMYIE